MMPRCVFARRRRRHSLHLRVVVREGEGTPAEKGPVHHPALGLRRRELRRAKRWVVRGSGHAVCARTKYLLAGLVLYSTAF